MQSRSCARVDLGAIGRNFDTLSRSLSSGVRAMAIVKADAYGHGAVEVARFLEDRADFFGVACGDEALELREAGIRKPILILSPIESALYGEVIKQEISVTLFSLDEAETLSKVATAMGKKAKVHLAVDTGMGRIGIFPDETGLQTALSIVRLQGLEPEGIFSHFATADEEDEAATLLQFARFDTFLEQLKAHGVTFPLRHVSNSAACLRFDKQYDMCRLGIALYGYAPSPVIAPLCEGLEVAMSVESRVIGVKRVPKGTPIGYGQTYFAPSERVIATVAIGYGDGYSRCIGGQGHVLLHGKKAPITGRICMDQIMVDVTEIPEVKAGDMAVIMGKSGEASITAQEIGDWSHSFHYEVICTFLPRVKRIYTK